METPKYAAFQEAGPADSLLAQIQGIGSEQERLMNELEELEQKLKEKKEELRIISEETMPNKMQEAGLTNFTTLSGTKFKLEEITVGNVPAPSTRDPDQMRRRSRIFKWLDDNGYGKLISRELKVEFDRSQAQEALELEQRLKADNFDVHRQYSVHPQTFNKFIRESLAGGVDLPEDFHVHRRLIVRVTKPST